MTNLGSSRCKIQFGEKVVSSTFPDILRVYFDKSFESNDVEFNFNTTEWISNNEITYIISWINALVKKEKRVTIELQKGDDILTTTKAYDRRKQTYERLIIDWQFELLVPPKARVNKYIKIDLDRISNITDPKPFVSTDTIDFNPNDFDKQFDDIYDSVLFSFVKYIKNQLSNTALIKYFDNYYFHYSLIKELFANACQHSNAEDCFFSMKYRAKVNPKNTKDLNYTLDSRREEHDSVTSEYFHSDEGKYLNEAYLEFNYIDFGDGITKSLVDKYLKDPEVTTYFGEEHKNQNLDSRVLEYAFLPFSSRLELSTRNSNNEFVPRGLYLVQNIVKRFKGMIVAQSNNGRVVFDYRGEAKVRYDNLESSKGTWISITFPERAKKINLLPSPISSKLSTIPEIEYLLVIQYLEHAKNTCSLDHYQGDSLSVLYDTFFSLLSDKIYQINCKHKRAIVLLDIAGISGREYASFILKLIYFLIKNTLINENINVIIVNAIDEELTNSFYLNSDLYKGNKLKDRGLPLKPIPIIFYNLKIGWIGIENIRLFELLTETWKQKDSSFIFTREENYNLHGNVLQVDFNTDELLEIRFSIPDFQQILTELRKGIASVILKELNYNKSNNIGIHFPSLFSVDELEKVHDYNIIRLTPPEDHIFLGANGFYQEVFLSFIEKLYIKEYRLLIGTYLVFLINDEFGGETERISKVLTVTLSSQLIGKIVVDLINKSRKSVKVKLVPLASYHEFNKEKAFEEILKDESVLLVCDVVSTGNLSNRVNKAVQERNANLLAVVSIVDSRTDYKLDINFLRTLDFPIFKISHSSKIPIWINPILNAPVTMRREKGNLFKVLFSPSEFIQFFETDEFFKVGNFSLNSVIHSYYLQTETFLTEETKNNFKILSKIFQRFLERIQDEDEIDNIKEFENQKYYLSGLIKKIEDESIKNIVQNYVDNNIYKSSPKSPNSYSQLPSRSNIILFFPFLSSISIIADKIDLLFPTNKPILTFPIPRIMTSKGWRFTFPPKSLNNICKDETVYLIDDGSCTGETIVQMIDTISFLPVKKIIVLSIFGRLEDFQLEFQTRLYTIRSSSNYIPVRVFLATNFHIQVHSPYLNHFKYEEEELRNTLNSKPPDFVQSYINLRLQIIAPKFTPDDSFQLPNPINKRRMFLYRDLLGQFEGNRFYKESSEPEFSFLDTNKLLRDEIDYNTFIAVLYHSPYLTNTLIRISPIIVSDIQEFILTQIKKGSQIVLKNYIFYISVLENINNICLLSNEFIIILFQISENEIVLKNSKAEISEFYELYYIAYLLFKEFKRNNLFGYRIEEIYNTLNTNEFSNTNSFKIIRQLYRFTIKERNVLGETELLSCFLSLKKYFDINSTLQPSHITDYKKLGDIITLIQGIQKHTGIVSKLNLEKISAALFEIFRSEYIGSLAFCMEFIQDCEIENFPYNVKHISKTLMEIQKVSRMKDVITIKNQDNFLNWLINDVRVIFDSNEITSKFFRSFGFEISKIWKDEKIISKCNEMHLKKRIVVNLKNDIDVPTYLYIHPYILDYFIDEILENCYKSISDANCDLYIYKEGNLIAIMFSQNKGFVPVAVYHGLSTIQKICGKHGYPFEMNKNESKFSLKICIPYEEPKEPSSHSFKL